MLYPQCKNTNTGWDADPIDVIIYYLIDVNNRNNLEMKTSHVCIYIKPNNRRIKVDSHLFPISISKHAFFGIHTLALFNGAITNTD